MIVLIIVVGDLIVQCFGARFCDPIHSSLFNGMLAAGSIELMFESAGIMKVYRRKEDKITKDKNDES